VTFQNELTSGGKPARNAVAVTPSDSVPLTFISQYLYIGGAGNVRVTLAGGDNVLLTALAVGVLHRLAVTHVYSTNTTATAIVALG